MLLLRSFACDEDEDEEGREKDRFSNSNQKIAFERGYIYTCECVRLQSAWTQQCSEKKNTQKKKKKREKTHSTHTLHTKHLTQPQCHQPHPHPTRSSRRRTTSPQPQHMCSACRAEKQGWQNVGGGCCWRCGCFWGCGCGWAASLILDADADADSALAGLLWLGGRRSRP